MLHQSVKHVGSLREQHRHLPVFIGRLLQASRAAFPNNDVAAAQAAHNTQLSERGDQPRPPPQSQSCTPTLPIRHWRSRTIVLSAYRKPDSIHDAIHLPVLHEPSCICSISKNPKSHHTMASCTVAQHAACSCITPAKHFRMQRRTCIGLSSHSTYLCIYRVAIVTSLPQFITVQPLLSLKLCV